MIKIGNLGISNIKLGSLTISKVFVGDEQIYPSSQPVETDLVIIYDVKSTSTPTKITNHPDYLTSMEVDGVEVSPITTGYTFSTTGEHRIKFTLANPITISTDAFSGCYDIAKVTIPYGVKYIGINAFSPGNSLTSVTIPNSVTTIMRSAFVCPNLTSVTIPDSVTSIEDGAFSLGNTIITVSTGNTVYDSRNNCNAIIETATDTLIIGSNYSIIPNDIVSIGNYAFNYCSGLINSITIPNSVTSIGIDTFRGCNRLPSITIPSGVTSIGENAFYGCTRLTSITVKATTPPTLGSSAFDKTNDCPIYVPAASVNAYKAAANWSTYASRIRAIQ